MLEDRSSVGLKGAASGAVAIRHGACQFTIDNLEVWAAAGKSM